MWRRCLLLLLCAVLTQWQTSDAWKIAALSPPDGNSLKVSAKIERGLQKYECDQGKWKETAASAQLLDMTTGAVIGSFRSVHDVRKRTSTMTWTLTNSAGDGAESGFTDSAVTAVPIASHKFSEETLPEYLAEASSHARVGAASQVSYVAFTNSKDGVAPCPSLCKMDFAIAAVPFYGVFNFFTQDTQPPASVPASLIPTGRIIEGIFVKGTIVYRFDGKGWNQKGILADLYDVCGGTLIGTFGTIRTADRYGSKLHWQINNPNGFSLTGQVWTKPVPVSKGSYAWNLMKITSSSGDTSLVGPYTYAQLLSTRGGEAPTQTAGVKVDLQWHSDFTAICWLYTT